VLGILAAATALSTPAHVPSPVGYEKFMSGRKGYHLVKADLASGLVSAETIYSHGLVSPWRLVSRAQPIAAITGTFFAPQNGTPVADVMVDGKLVARGNRGSVLGVTEGGEIVIADQGYRRKFDWTGIKHGLRGAVRLISNGKVAPNPRAQRFKDPRIWGRAARTGVGVDHNGKVVLVATRQDVTLSELGRAMKKKGVVDAVSLDGGGSTCLYYNGKMVVSTGRRLSNMFVITENHLAEHQ
jgi:exopolysaccharide biosynthesis protein